MCIRDRHGQGANRMMFHMKNIHFEIDPLLRYVVMHTDWGNDLLRNEDGGGQIMDVNFALENAPSEAGSSNAPTPDNYETLGKPPAKIQSDFFFITRGIVVQMEALESSNSYLLHHFEDCTLLQN
eukprot:TRINITY_DN9229_c0_g1_i6.p2 TRINITY_DN9229_c0_g1~~TRINITY_DN9229_c0_g1_i6.p2  ORF type:complete len:125 (-),score=14.86 TRINITY_DN9229_c0_g1_i6:116-490(-)